MSFDWDLLLRSAMFGVGVIVVLIIGMALYVTFGIWRPGGLKSPPPPKKRLRRPDTARVPRLSFGEALKNTF